jgi:competence protein ComEA
VPRRHRARFPADLPAAALQRVASLRAGRAGWVPQQPEPATAEPLPEQGPPRTDPAPGADGALLPDSDTAEAERVPGLLRSARFGLEPRAVLGLAMLATLAVAVGGFFLWRAADAGPGVMAPRTSGGIPVASPPVPAGAPVAGTTPAADAPTPGTAAGTAPGGGASPATPPARLLVHVAGHVRRAGVVELAAGARVGDALAAAGGATGKADLAALNLARPVTDGEQVLVLAPGESPPAAAGSVPPSGPGTLPGPPSGGAGSAGAAQGGAGAAAGSGAPVDLNTATLEQLDTLPGVGPVLAQRILDWRAQNGGFRAVEELQEVSGIGEKRYAELAALVRV